MNRLIIYYKPYNWQKQTNISIYYWIIIAEEDITGLKIDIFVMK